MKKQLLFTAYQDAGMDEGFTYALDLAKTMNEDLTILLVNENGMSRFEQLMSAITFAEANDHDTAREIMAEPHKEKLSHLLDRCKGNGVSVNVHTARKDAVTAIKDYLRGRSNVDMVLLAPNITNNGNFSEKNMKRLISVASRPVVKIKKGALAPHESA